MSNEKKPSARSPEERLPKDGTSRDGTSLTYEEWKRKQSRRIYQLRMQTGLTQKEFAALVGWSPSQQSQIEQCAEAVRIRPMHVMTARFVAKQPLEALQMTYELPEEVREKVEAYAERLREFGIP